MKFTRLSIPDVILIEPRVFDDPRGFFYESYREDLFHQNGIPERFIQDNHSCSSKGVLRGLHYQLPPKAQSKLIRVVRGEIFDVVVDVRKSSPTFGKQVSVVLNAQDKKMLYVPAGFAHGFCTMEDGTEVLYKVNELYSPQHERGVLWNDPDLKIAWPDLKIPYTLSQKDQKYPRLKNAELYQ
ncbi:MAG: dTDP-4-dehydrorhamnose 3,5-epimerase [Candidatus Omnitrophica bacterium]|nr:dTDP-4-dehydrorhamnose 3,5-epimerase [Candidatus Omnitrophota bacterium]